MKAKKLSGILTRKQKNKDKKEWYKRKADEYEAMSLTTYDERGVSDFRRMKINYDLFNNKIDLQEFEYVCNPFGEDFGHTPAKMTNKDISSGKIKVLIGMQSRRPFSYKILAVNPEATTRREQEEFSQIREYVVNQITKPIRQQIELELEQEIAGQELTPDQEQEVMQRLEEELQTRTPKEVKKYMAREYQDPAEMMANQLITYLYKKLNLEKIFDLAFKHGALSAKQVVYVGVKNGEPIVLPVNSLRFNSDRSPDLLTIEEGEWATYEFRMSPVACVSFFSKELTEEEANRIMELSSYGGSYDPSEDLFSRIDSDYEEENSNYISVRHAVWKHPRKIGFLTYINEFGEEAETTVDETYKLNKDFGDIKIEWEMIPETHETWKICIGEPIYVRMGPIPGQHKDLDNLYESFLPYYGVYWDNLNSKETSIMDRLIDYQYFYNIIDYRIQKLLATDKGKKVLMNIRSLPDSLKMSLKKWMHTSDVTPYMWFDPGEEGSEYSTPASNIAQVLDLSLISDLSKYFELQESIRVQAGRSIGITDNVEGQTAEREAVRNTQQNLIQSSYLLEPYFKLNDHFKANVIKGLIEASKVAYEGSKPIKLSYILDDLSVATLDLDIGLLDNNTLGIFLADGSELQRIKETIEGLAHAAMQNQTIELSDVAKVMKVDDITEAEELLRVAEEERREFEIQQQREQQQHLEQEAEKAREFIREQHEMEKEKIVLKEEERRKTEIIKGALTGASFNPDLDKDKDGQNDFIEIAKQGLDADIKQTKARLEREEFEHKKEMDRIGASQKDEELKIEKEKIKAQNNKPKSK